MSNAWTYPLPKVPITASQVGTRIPVSLGGSFQQSVWVELSNESPYILSVLSSQGILLNQLQPQQTDIAQIPPGDTSFILVPILLLPQASPSSEVDISVYPFGKPEGAYPFPLGRQAAPTAGTSLIGYRTTNTFASTSATNPCAVAIFNPANSGQLFTFYATRFVTNDTASLILPEIAFINANLSLPFSAQFLGSNTINNPVGNAIVSVANGGTAIAGLTIMEQAIAFANTLLDFIPFPDQIALPPGFSFVLLCTITAGKNVSMSQKWTVS